MRKHFEQYPFRLIDVIKKLNTVWILTKFTEIIKIKNWIGKYVYCYDKDMKCYLNSIKKIFNTN